MSNEVAKIRVRVKKLKVPFRLANPEGIPFQLDGLRDWYLSVMEGDPAHPPIVLACVALWNIDGPSDRASQIGHAASCYWVSTVKGLPIVSIPSLAKDLLTSDILRAAVGIPVAEPEETL
jgi:hypothetical protein